MKMNLWKGDDKKETINDYIDAALNINNLILLNIYFHLDRFLLFIGVVSGVYCLVAFFLLYAVVH